MSEVDVSAKDSHDVLVVERLQTLGVALLSEWDALAFLYHHAASLGTAAEIARLLGYDKAEIGAALHSLEELGLIRRSRASQGIRVYQFSEPPEPSRRSCLLELMKLAHDRAGRMVLLQHLRPPLHQPQQKRRSGLHLA